MNNSTKNHELHIFENHHNYDLKLPKPSHKGFTLINSKKQFLADKSFLEYVKNGMIRYIGPYQKEEVIVENKLICEQPPTVTTQGKVENFVVQPKVYKNTCGKAKIISDNNLNEETTDVLLCESPSDGIMIVE